MFTLRYLLAQHSAQGVVPERPLEVVFNPEAGGTSASGLVDVTLWAVPAAQRASVASAIDEALPRLAAWIATTADRNMTWLNELHGMYVEMTDGIGHPCDLPGCAASADPSETAGPRAPTASRAGARTGRMPAVQRGGS